jgi:hypothetical protein
MFSINAYDYKLGTLHIGGDGNIYRCSKTIRGQGHWWELQETRDLNELITRVMADEQMTPEEKINALTEVPENVGTNFFGSCQYYSAWQIYYLCHLAQEYDELDISQLGLDCDIGGPASANHFETQLQLFREADLETMFPGDEEENVEIAMDNKWGLWFTVGCPESAHPVELVKSDAVWLTTDLATLLKEDRKRVRKYQKKKLKRVLQWLQNINSEEVLTDLGGVELIRAKIPKKVIKVIKRRVSWKHPELPYNLRSSKDDKKFDKLLRKAAKGDQTRAKKLRKKAHRKYGLNIAWDKLKFPKVTDPTRSIQYFSIPIEAVPTGVAKVHRDQLAARKAKWKAGLDKIKSARDWLLWLMRHNDMWTGIPKVFSALLPNATVNAPVARSPNNFLANDWSTNYCIGMMCYMLKYGGHIKADEDLECDNS